MLITQNPFPQFFDTAGKPLTDGRIYFGVAGQNPRTSPVAIYTDAAGTQPIAQPVRTLGGYPVRNGSPVNIFTPSTYSVAVYTASGTLVAYAPDSAAFDSVLSATTAFTRTLLDDPDAATARATLGAASLGANTFTGAQTLPGNAGNPLEAVPKQQLDASPGRLLAVRVFTTANSGQIYTPTTGTTSVIVQSVGGGAAAGGTFATGAGQVAVPGAGGSGSYGLARFNSGFSGAILTIGSAGVGVSAANGGNGGTTSFGALLSCPGGVGGNAGGSASSGGAYVNTSNSLGADCSGANIISMRGSIGTPSIWTASTSFVAGEGGSTPIGRGGFSAAAPTGYGAGGAAAIVGPVAAATAGQNGTPGAIIVWEYA